MYASLLAVSLTLQAPYLPIFDRGPLTNLHAGDAAVTNASAHVGWALAVPLAGKAAFGRKGMWISGVSWIGLTVFQEACMHPHPRVGYGPEVRTDLLTRIVPTLLVLGIDLVQGGSK